MKHDKFISKCPTVLVNLWFEEIPNFWNTFETFETCRIHVKALYSAGKLVIWRDSKFSEHIQSFETCQNIFKAPYSAGKLVIRNKIETFETCRSHVKATYSAGKLVIQRDSILSKHILNFRNMSNSCENTLEHW